MNAKHYMELCASMGIDRGALDKGFAPEPIVPPDPYGKGVPSKRVRATDLGPVKDLSGLNDWPHGRKPCSGRPRTTSNYKQKGKA